MSLLRFFKLLSNNDNEATFTEEGSKVSQDVELTSSTSNVNGDKSVRVVVTKAAPNNIVLSDSVVQSGASLGTVIGTLSTLGGESPYTYSIENDPDNKFDLVNGNELILDGVVDDQVDPDHDVTIRTTDFLGNTFDKTFTIDVTPAPLYSNDFSLTFNGVDERIETDFDFSGRDKFTINVYMDQVSSSNRLDVSQSNSGNSDRVKVLRNNNNTAVVVLDGSVVTYADTSSSWLMLTLVYDGTLSSANRVKLYFDGIQQTPTNTSGTPPASISTIADPFYIGYDKGANAFANGKIDEVSIWDEPLTPSEVTELYNSGTPLNLNTHSRFSDLISWWRMGEDLSVPTIPDQKGPHDGTLENMGIANRSTDTP